MAEIRRVIKDRERSPGIRDRSTARRASPRDDPWQHGITSDNQYPDRGLEGLTQSLDPGRRRTLNRAKIDEKKPDAQDELRIELRVLDRKVDIRLADDASFKDVIKAFMLMGQIVGDAASLARKANSSVNMPPTPGSGLPPVGLP